MIYTSLVGQHYGRPDLSASWTMDGGRRSARFDRRHKLRGVMLWRLLLVVLCFFPAWCQYGNCEEPEVTVKSGREAAEKLKWPRVSHYCWVRNVNLQRLAESIATPVCADVVCKVTRPSHVVFMRPPNPAGVRWGGALDMHEMRSSEECRREAMDWHYRAASGYGMVPFYVVPLKYGDGAVDCCYMKGMKEEKRLFLFFNNVGLLLHVQCGREGDPDPEKLLASLDAAFRPKKLDVPPEPGTQVRSIPLALKSDKPLVTEMVYKLEAADIGREEVWFYCPGGLFEETNAGMVVKFVDEGVRELSCVTYDAAGKRSGVGRLLVNVIEKPAEAGPK